MNQSTQKTETPPLSLVPIPRRGIPGFAGILLFILLALSALILPLCIAALLGTPTLPLPALEGGALLYLLLLIFYFGRTAKLVGKFSRGVPILIVISSIATYTVMSTLLPVALCFSLVFAVGEGSVLLSVASKKQLALFPLTFLSAFALSLLLTRQLDLALVTLLPFPAALVLALGTRSSAGKSNGLTRVGVICATSLTLGVTAGVFVLWFAYRALGSFELSLITEKLDAFRDLLTTELINTELSYGGKITKPLEGKEAEVRNIVNGMVNTLPGTLVVVVNVFTALSQMVALSGLHAYGYGASLSPRVRDFRISPISAFVFLISWIVALVAVGDNNASTLAGTVAENLFTVLVPGLALSGFFRMMRAMIQKGSRLGCGVFLLVLVPCIIAYVPTLLAFYDAIGSVFGPLFKKKKKNDKKDPPVDKGGHPTRPLTDEELFELYCRDREQKNDKNDHER